MDAIAVAILGLIALSLVGLLAMIRRRAWNADGSDDARREDPKTDGAAGPQRFR